MIPRESIGIWKTTVTQSVENEEEDDFILK